MGGWKEWLKNLLPLHDKKKPAPVSQTGSIMVEQTGPQRLLLRVTGMVSLRHVEAAQHRTLEITEPGRQFRGLIRAEGFTGFARDAAGGMDAIQRMYALNEVVERIAVVADPAKHGELDLFMGGWMRRAGVKCFAPSELEKAKAWLES